jgi:hypothetical protein
MSELSDLARTYARIARAECNRRARRARCRALARDLALQVYPYGTAHYEMLVRKFTPHIEASPAFNPPPSVVTPA